MHIDKEKECHRLIGALLTAGHNLARACQDSERAALVWNKRRYLRETSVLLNELLHTLQYKHQMDNVA